MAAEKFFLRRDAANHLQGTVSLFIYKESFAGMRMTLKYHPPEADDTDQLKLVAL